MPTRIRDSAPGCSDSAEDGPSGARRRVSITSTDNPPDPPRDLWSRPPGWDTLYVKADGQVFADEERYGVHYAGLDRVMGRPQPMDVRRRPSRGWSDIVEELLERGLQEEEFGAAERLGRLLAPEQRRSRLRVQWWAWRRWRRRLDVLVADGMVLTADAAMEALAQAQWWEGEHMATRQPARCGTRTAEHAGVSTVTWAEVLMVWRLRCESWRCPHCARAIHGAETAARARLGWEQCRGEGRWLWFVTLTTDWPARLAELGVGHWSEEAKRKVAWSQIGRMVGRLITRDLDREGIEPWDLWARKFEAHKSRYPHVHLLVGLRDDDLGEDDLGSAALREAGCRSTMELVAALADRERDGSYRQALVSWHDSIDGWQRGGRRGRRPRKPHPPRRLPYSRTRQRLIAAARRAGFGKSLHLRPVDAEDLATRGDPFLYFSKPFFGMGEHTDIPDTGGPEREFAKATQVEGALPSGVRVVGWSGRWPKLKRRPGEPLDPTTSTFALHSAPIESVRAYAEMRGWSTTGEVYKLDLHGPVPERGARRVGQLESCMIEADVRGLTLLHDGLLPTSADDDYAWSAASVVGDPIAARSHGG